MKYFSLLMLLLLLSACEKPPIVPPVVPPDPPPCGDFCDTTVLKFLWQQPIGQDTGNYLSDVPVIFGDNVIITKMFGGPHDIVKMFNGNDGQLLWSWENPTDISDGEEISDMKSYENKLVVCAGSQVNLLNMNTGTMLWRSDVMIKNGCGIPRINLISDQIYHTHSACGIFKDSVNYLVRTSVSAPKWDTIFHLSVDSNWNFPTIHPGVLWVNPVGDSVYLFQNRAISHHSDRVDFIALSLQSRKVLWRLDSIDAVSSITLPYVYQNRIYFLGHHTLFCIDPANGSIIWHRDFPAGLYTTNILVAENKLVIHPNNHSLYALDPATGATLWSTINTGGADAYLEYYHGHVFYASEGSGDIYIHNIKNGALVKKLGTPNGMKYTDASFSNPLAIDQENGRLYVTDWHFVVCYQIKL